jgi:uncharacterized protein (DUF2147 family)
MRRIAVLGPVFAAALLAMGASARAEAAAEPEVAGVWLTGKRKVAVDLYPCGAALCGRIVWLAKPLDGDGALKRDGENPDPALRDRPICGIDIISGLTPAGDGVWEDGRFYYPTHGRSYDFKVEREGERLSVRAYVGVQALGRSETWIRAEASQRGCTAAPS